MRAYKQKITNSSTSNEELVTRIVEVFYDSAEGQFSKKDLRLVKVFLNGVEFESAPQ